MPTLSRITIYPIKSLDGYDATAAKVLPSGALENDRRWAIVDGQGRYINGKRTAAVHQIRATFAENIASVALSADGNVGHFQLPAESPALAQWLSDAFQLKCRLIENADGGFPDDGDASGPTIISTASLAAAASWFPEINVAEMRRRIRANLETDAPDPFWEDHLADDGLSPRRIAVGGVVYRGRTICQRCVVPTRDARSGETLPGFVPKFAAERKRLLPTWAPIDQFDHYYRLAINTAPDSIDDGATVRLGDQVRLLTR